MGEVPDAAKPFGEIPDADWVRFFEVNVLSGVRLARRYTPRMTARKWGRVIFISWAVPDTGLTHQRPAGTR